jgi:hypothetical protein
MRQYVKSLLLKTAAVVGLSVAAVTTAVGPASASTVKTFNTCTAWQRVGKTTVYARTCIGNNVLTNHYDHSSTDGFAGFVEVKNTSRIAVKVDALQILSHVDKGKKKVEDWRFHRKVTLSVAGRAVRLNHSPIWYGHVDLYGKGINQATFTVTGPHNVRGTLGQTVSYTVPYLA